MKRLASLSKLFDLITVILSLNFRQKKTDRKTTGGLAMRKARIFNYYNKRPTHLRAGNEKNYRVQALRTQAINVIKLHFRNLPSFFLADKYQ